MGPPLTWDWKTREIFPEDAGWAEGRERRRSRRRGKN
jgi:hypothetical protein